MSIVRRFLVAPALVRLIRKERGGSRVSEGYFAPQAGRTSFVRIDGQNCHLVLVNHGPDGASAEERTEVPRAHGDALLDVCGGKAVYERTSVSLGAGREALIDRYTTPAGLDLISVSFDEANAAEAFRPPPWFGAEVSGDEAYERHAVALKGVPVAGEATLSNAALDAVLDLIEPRFGFSRPAAPSPRRDEPPAAPQAAPAPAAAVLPPAPKPPAPAPAASTAAAAAPAPAAAAPPVPKPPAPAAAAPAASAPAAAVPAPPAPKAAAPAVAPAPAAPAPPPAQSVAPSAPKPAAPPAAVPEAAKASPPEPPKAAVKPPEPETPSAKDQAPPSPKSEQGDTRIDDVIESLSQALGAAIQKPQAPAREDELAASFERWTVRPRRTQQ